jgi:hypothetical protein
MQVSIGLPSFFMDKGSHTAILIVYLMVLVVLIPVAVGTYYASTNKLGENGIMKITCVRVRQAWSRRLVRVGLPVCVLVVRRHHHLASSSRRPAWTRRARACVRVQVRPNPEPVPAGPVVEQQNGA